MMLTFKRTVPALRLSISLSTAASQAQSTTTTYTNRRGDTMTDTISTQNGIYTNGKTVTTPNGRTHTNDYKLEREQQRPGRHYRYADRSQWKVCEPDYYARPAPK